MHRSCLASERAAVLWALLCLGGGKCIPYDERLAHDAPRDGGPGGSAVACPQADEAHLRVLEYAFPILCGCREPPWNGETPGSKTCTVPVGTTVVWEFAGSVEHNVTSVDGRFAGSDDQGSGTFRRTLTSPGTYSFKCALHGGLMSGYTVVAVEPGDAGAPDGGGTG